MQQQTAASSRHRICTPCSHFTACTAGSVDLRVEVSEMALRPDCALHQAQYRMQLHIDSIMQAPYLQLLQTHCKPTACTACLQRQARIRPASLQNKRCSSGSVGDTNLQSLDAECSCAAAAPCMQCIECFYIPTAWNSACKCQPARGQASSQGDLLKLCWHWTICISVWQPLHVSAFCMQSDGCLSHRDSTQPVHAKASRNGTSSEGNLLQLRWHCTMCIPEWQQLHVWCVMYAVNSL